MTTAITAETITTAQIRDLQREADEHGDTYQAEICQIASAAHETADAEGHDLIGPDGAIWTRTEAREHCASVINDAAAQS